MKLKSNKMETDKYKRILWVDGLKGICALIVVIDHIFAYVSGVEYNHSLKTPILHNLWDGNFAVSVFIILSTLLTCYGINGHRKSIVDWYSNVVLKRYFRILIPTGFVMLLMFTANMFGLYADGIGDPVSLASFIHLPGNVLFAPLGGGFDILFVTWMLKYVFLGTMWTVILDLLLYKRRVVGQLVLLMFCCYFAYKIDFYYVNIIAGYAIYYILVPHLKSVNGGAKFMLGLAIMLMFFLSDFYYYTPKWNMFRAILLVCCVVTMPHFDKCLTGKTLVWLGKISMNIYLLHMLVIYIITCRMRTLMELTIINQVVIYGTTMIVVLFLSHMFTLYVEPRLNMLTNKIVRAFS